MPKATKAKTRQSNTKQAQTPKAAKAKGPAAKTRKAEVGKAKAAKAESAKAESAKAESAKSESAKSKAAKAGSAKAKSPKAGARKLALLRGINVGGNKKVPMGELRVLAQGLGWQDVETYIQSGNLVFSSNARAALLEAQLEAAIAKRFGFSVDVVVRDAQALADYVAKNPFPEVALEAPARLLLAFAKAPVRTGALAVLEPYQKYGERVAALKDALWIDFLAGAGKSKLTPAVLDRAAGSTVTARNYRTVLELIAMTQR